MYIRIIKPVIDRLVGFLGLLSLSPLLLVLILLGIGHFRGNPFFLQKRVGKKEKIFYIVKFRTMTHVKDEKGKLLPDSLRLTPFGKFMRKYSLDELPQFFNLLVGDMSMIGPRPLLVEYLSLYSEVQSRRHLVKPGITGLAQINGRNGISWERKFQFDVMYVEEQSFGLDAHIFLKSFQQLFLPKNIYGKGGEVKPFKGSREK